jgi:hypothetical protein
MSSNEVLEDSASTSEEAVGTHVEAEATDQDEVLPEALESDHQAHPVMPPVPHIEGVDSDVLKNLLMSWFYTGYYTAKAEMSSIH